MSDVNFNDYLIEVRRGNIAGHSIEQKFGRDIAVVNNVWSLVSSVGLAEALPASGSPVRIKVSGDVGDIGGGAGPGIVEVVGLSDGLQEVSENLVTSGALASLSTTTNFLRVYRASTAEVGTYNGANIGDIVIETAGGDSNRIIISADEGQTQHGAYCIPLGKTGYLLSTHVMADAGKAADFRLFVRENLTQTQYPMASKRLKLYFDGVLGQASYETSSPTIIIPALSDIWIESRGGGAGTEVSVNFEILLVDDQTSHIKQI